MSDVRARLQSALGSSYTLDRELGGGGMSRVFVATETALNRSVVIKVVAPELLEGLSAERFAREVKLAARLQQANIVPVLAAGDANGLPFYTMPFVRGESLRARLASGATISVADAVHILRDVAQALAYAHAEGIVHRDIKPENVLLSGGAAVVTDFGIAKAIDVSRTQDGDQPGGSRVTLTRTGSSLGTPAYMSPEQAAGDPHVDHRADIYAWGMMAWELLAGRHPFASKASLPALVAAQLSEVPAPVAAVRSDVPAALSALVQRCVEKEPGRRPASASELLALLDQATSGESRAAERVPAARRRRRITIIGIGAFATVVLITLVVKWWPGRVAGDTSIERSLAIIPFTTPANDSVSAYLGVGIADEVSNELSEIPGLQLAGRSSAARFTGKGAKEAGEALKVAMVLDGSIVPWTRDTVRVTAVLTSVSDEHEVWHEIDTVATDNVIAVQDRIARAIAGQLHARLVDIGRRRGTKDAAAYDSYLQGIYLYRRRVSFPKAIDALNEAVRRDPKFAQAWAALAHALALEPQYERVRISTVLPQARQAAERAVHLDPKLSDGHAALGLVHSEAFEWSKAEAELKLAIELDSTAAEPLFRLGIVLLNRGHVADAIPQLQAAVDRDKLYFIATLYLGFAELLSGRTEGLEKERRAVALEPSFTVSTLILALSFSRAGMLDSARWYAHRIMWKETRRQNRGTLAYVLARSGAMDDARILVDSLEASPPDAWNLGSGLMAAYLGTGDSTKAIDAMEHLAAGDGDEFPPFAIRFIREFPSGPRVDSVFRRFNLDPRLFVKGGGGR